MLTRVAGVLTTRVGQLGSWWMSFFRRWGNGPREGEGLGGCPMCLAGAANAALPLRPQPPAALSDWAPVTCCRFIHMFQQSERPRNHPRSVWPHFIGGVGFISYWPISIEHSFLHWVRPFPFRAFFSFSFFLLSIRGHVHASVFWNAVSITLDTIFRN